METIQPVSFHSTPITSWFGAGLHNAAFFIPADAANLQNAQCQTVLHRDRARSDLDTTRHHVGELLAYLERNQGRLMLHFKLL
jgi:hypothetical protein